MNFRNLTCELLAQYKVDVLRVQEDGVFHYRGRAIRKSHILPTDLRDINILEGYRAKFWSSDFAKIRLHQFFHHLNSSQALCINLFYPLIAENALDHFLRFLGISPEVVARAIFEKESEIEASARRTSFDFYVQLVSARGIFVEVKYTEDGFASAKSDSEHRDKFRTTYLSLVEASTFLVHECQEETLFLRHYQVLRNLVHISEADRVVLLFPSANTVVAKEAAYARDHLLTDSGRERFTIVYLEEFVSFLEAQCVGGPLDGYYQTFRTKYLTQHRSMRNIGAAI